MISKIMEIDPANKNILKIVAFDKTITAKDLNLIYEEFGFDKKQIDKSVHDYRNVALILGLAKVDADYTADWHDFLDRSFPKQYTGKKLDNIFLSQDYRKLLLITNRRLVTLDLKRVNEKLTRINTEIGLYNEKLKANVPAEKKSFISSIKAIFAR